MALQIKGMSRTFKFKKGTEYVTLQDPEPNLSPDMVMSYYSNFYPELTTATVHVPSSEMTGPCTSSRQPSGQKADGYG